MKYITRCIVILAFVPPLLVAQPNSDIRVLLEGDWLTASRGSDESAQIIKLKVWGSLRDPSKFEGGFEQLDGDSEKEYVVISRNPGTGPYYKLQVIDFHFNGIFTWSYDSFGRPKVENGNIYLGGPQRYQGAADVLKYTKYNFTTRGLVPAN